MSTEAVASIVDERRRFADTLADVGPHAPTLAGAWDAHDLAAHVVALDRLAGGPTFLGRSIVTRGVRLNDVGSRFADATMRVSRRRGFEWALGHLRARPPRLLLRPSVAGVGLFEVFVHHEDVRRAAPEWTRRDPPPALAETIPWLLRYHRRVVPGVRLTVRTGGVEWDVGEGPVVVLGGDVSEVVVWLAGRRAVAAVALDGDDDAVERVRATPFGI